MPSPQDTKCHVVSAVKIGHGLNRKAAVRGFGGTDSAVSLLW